MCNYRCVHIYIYIDIDNKYMYTYIWVVIKIMVPFWALGIIRHLVFRGPRRGP